MTKKDYIKIAAVLRDVAKRPPVPHYCEPETREDILRLVATEIAHVFADDNPRFDRARFFAACQ